MGSKKYSPGTAVVLFTRDLRVHDHPALAAAAMVAERVVPVFVLDAALIGSAFACPNRLALLLEPLRALAARPRRLALPRDLDRGRLPELRELTSGVPSPALPAGGEAAARARLDAWLRRGLARYAERHDDVAADAPRA
jgi:deoxyribodipyrimidine photo-lyase